MTTKRKSQKENGREIKSNKILTCIILMQPVSYNKTMAIKTEAATCSDGNLAAKTWNRWQHDHCLGECAGSYLVHKQCTPVECKPNREKPQNSTRLRPL